MQIHTELVDEVKRNIKVRTQRNWKQTNEKNNELKTKKRIKRNRRGYTNAGGQTGNREKEKERIDNLMKKFCCDKKKVYEKKNIAVRTVRNTKRREREVEMRIEKSAYRKNVKIKKKRRKRCTRNITHNKLDACTTECAPEMHLTFRLLQFFYTHFFNNIKKSLFTNSEKHNLHRIYSVVTYAGCFLRGKCVRCVS